MKDEIIVVLDRSGSMERIRTDMVGGLRDFVQQQRSIGPAGFTLARFDDQYELVVEGKPLADFVVGDDVLVPRGMTALFDAVGKTVQSQGERFAQLPEAERPQRVVLLIITDGLENASRDWAGDRVRALLERQQNEWKWAVTFLGCGIDAIKGATQVGVPAFAALNVAPDPKSIRASFDSAGAVMTSYRHSGTLRDYTEDERKRSAGQGGK